MDQKSWELMCLAQGHKAALTMGIEQRSSRFESDAITLSLGYL